MTKILLATGYVHATLDLDGPCETLAEVTDQVDRRLPGGWRLHRPHAADATGQLPRVAVTAADHEPSVTAPPGEPPTVCARLRPAAFMSPTLAYVAYTALERQRQLKGMLTVHAASAVVPGRGAILLLGDKGSGKTSTLLALTRRGCTPAGDDLLILHRRPGFMEVLPGNRVAAARPDIPRPEPFHYENKREVPLDDDGFLGDAAPVVRVVRLNVHTAAPQRHLRQVYHLSVNERLRLHENLTRHISGIPTPLELHDNGSHGPVWPLDTDECSRFRAEMTNLFARAPFYYLQARDADEAADLLLEATRP